MSRELREKADRISRELREALIPLRNEINRLKNISIYSDKNTKSAHP